MIFDSHAHYDDIKFNEDRAVLLGGLQREGIGMVVNIGASIRTSEASLRLAEAYPFIYAAVGVHPSEVEELTPELLRKLGQMAEHEKAVAIGEIGLDYHYDTPEPKQQKYWFEAQLALAEELGKPVVIHSRDAAKDTLDMMERYTPNLSGGVIHCFSYSPEVAREFVDMGYYIGVGGVLTFKNGRKLVETVEQIPLERIVLETDCPYLSPEPYRGQRNDSTRLHLIVSRLSEILGIEETELVRITRENTMKLYGMV